MGYPAEFAKEGKFAMYSDNAEQEEMQDFRETQTRVTSVPIIAGFGSIRGHTGRPRKARPISRIQLESPSACCWRLPCFDDCFLKGLVI